MNLKKFATIILLGFVAVSLIYLVVRESGKTAALPSADEASAAAPAHKVVAYYFHGFQRCKTCLQIEASAKQAVETAFPQELKDGRLEWKVVNFEEETNAPMASHYELVASSLVIVDFRDGQEQQWKNLDKVWDLVWEDQAFSDYVREEVWNYLHADRQDG